MLELKNIVAGYQHFAVLKDVNLKIKESEIVALIGPNGAGKSTIIKSIYNIAQVQKGQILYRAEDITRLPTHQLIQKGIAYVNQGKIVFGNLSVSENLELAGQMRFGQKKVLSLKEKVYQKFPALLEKRRQLAFTLSGGQQQQLALGRAVMQEPKVLLLDEPSLGLSPKLMLELFQSIVDLKREGLAIFIVEQNAKKAIEMADRTYLLEDGQIAMEGGKEILENPAIKAVYLGGHY